MNISKSNQYSKNLDENKVLKMSTKLFVGNLPYTITEEELKELFSNHGNVEEVKIVREQETGRSKGFGFVSMSSEEECKNAIDNLNGQEINSRKIKVDTAIDRGSSRGGDQRRQRSFNKRYGND